MLLLNLGIVKQQLSTEPEAVCGNLYHDLVLTTVRLLPQETCHEYRADHLYIMRWDQWPDSDNYPLHVVCIGGGDEAKEFFSACGTNCLIFDAVLDIALLFSEIQDIFTYFHNLHTEYRLHLMTRKPMNMILDFCMSLMKNFVFLLNAEYGIIETSSFYSGNDAEVSPIHKNNLTPTINNIITRLKGISPSPNEESGLLVEQMPAADDTPAFLYTRFFNSNRHVATLVVCQTSSPFYPFTIPLLQYLVNLLQPCIVGRYSPALKPRHYIRSALFSLLEEKICNLNVLLYNLSLMGWNVNDPYRLIYINILPSAGRSISAADYYRYENLFPDCIFVNHPSHSHAVLVIHNTPDEIPASAIANLRDLLTSEKMKCRIGLPFNNFLEIPAHFDLLQSSILSVGDQLECVSMYKDIMTKHIISEFSASFPIFALCHRAAIQLYEHDCRHGTELLVTLEKYLYYNRSIQKAGEVLFIHRNTINYRLRKIEEITKLSLNESEETLYLLLSCMVLRTRGETDFAAPFSYPGSNAATSRYYGNLSSQRNEI